MKHYGPMERPWALFDVNNMLIREGMYFGGEFYIILWFFFNAFGVYIYM